MILLLAQDVAEIEGFGELEYANQTLVHPVGLVVLAVCCGAVLFLPRRRAALPLLVMAALIPSAQRFAIVDLDFTFLRVLIVAGWLRVLARGEHLGFRWRRLDVLFVAWALAAFVVPCLRRGPSVLQYQLGITFDALGGYFLFRWLITDLADIERIARTVVVLSVPLALAFLLEQATQHNVFAVFGGVNATTMVREERLRCMGPYNHPIVAGCFWVSLMPLCVARWWRGAGGRWEAWVGGLACLVVVFCCASSTPIFGLIAGLIAACAYLLRRRMRLVRWACLLGLVALHLMMNHPVWHLLCRISAVGGSTGYHRYQLINSLVYRFSEWALLGTDQTAYWFWGGQDVTNQFVAQGVNGGVWTFGLFVALVVAAFAGVGRLRARYAGDRVHEPLAWALGVVLFVHCACFIGVSYFGQIVTLWYLMLAMIGSVTPAANATKSVAAPLSRAPAKLGPVARARLAVAARRR